MRKRIARSTVGAPLSVLLIGAGPFRHAVANVVASLNVLAPRMIKIEYFRLTALAGASATPLA